MNFTSIATKTIRNLLSRKEDRYVFSKFDISQEIITFPEKGGLYIHVPFCKSMCPYCPYYKVYFNQDLAAKYKSALLKEIEKYSQIVKDVKFTSLYIGGGTPTLMIDDLFDIVSHVRNYLDFSGSIGLETTPKDLSRENLDKLRKLGVNLLSIGVQSFQDKFLKCIGRNYCQSDISENLSAVKEYNFKTVNFDMIFALPGQSSEDLMCDLDSALRFLPDQVTCYPLFTFPYTSIGEYKKLNRLKLPKISKRRKMYYLIHKCLQERGYVRSSVWSFSKGKTDPYSSVTRDFYLGLGPGAGSYTKDGFYFNIFSVEDYVSRLQKDNELPLVLKMDVSQRMAKLFWLYWRLYETEIPKKDYGYLFSSNLQDDFSFILKAIKLLGFAEKEDKSSFRLNKRGTHWIHLLQNYFALNYVTKIWTECINNPIPQEIAI